MSANVHPMKRAAIFVRDLHESLDFYETLLGLDTWVQGEGTGIPAFTQLLGIDRASVVRYVILKSGDTTIGMVGLFELSEPAPQPVQRQIPGAANAGEVALVFHADDVEHIHRGMLARGLPVICEPIRLEIPQLKVVSLEMTGRDPNGVLVNFIQQLQGPH
ncbi:MAG TPA: VOC family protein [Steroidobacteraceae bacterium]|nr:VOC family protein [Steroidobacteraceae bacterium]